MYLNYRNFSVDFSEETIPTILSRCQRYSFRRLDADVIAKRLNYIAAREGFKLTEGGSALIARLADGGMSWLPTAAASGRSLLRSNA